MPMVTMMNTSTGTPWFPDRHILGVNDGGDCGAMTTTKRRRGITIPHQWMRVLRKLAVRLHSTDTQDVSEASSSIEDAANEGSNGPNFCLAWRIMAPG